MRLPRRAWVLSSIIVIALVLWGIWTMRPGEVATRRLPDGSVLTLKATTYQMRHRIRTGNRWLDFTLVELKTGSPAFTDYPGASGAWVSFRVSENGRPTSAWEFAGFNGISDALGHAVASGAYTTTMTDAGAYRIGVNPGLCAEEAAWRVDAEFARSKDFPTADLWTIRSVPVPGRNTASVVEAVTNLHGVRFRFCGIVGAGCPEPRLRRSVSGSPVAHVACTNLPRDLQLKFVRAADDRGRKVESGGSASDPPDYLFGLRLAPDAKTVDFTFAATKRVPVQYLVKPSRLSAAELKKDQTR